MALVTLPDDLEMCALHNLNPEDWVILFNFQHLQKVFQPNLFSLQALLKFYEESTCGLFFDDTDCESPRWKKLTKFPTLEGDDDSASSVVVARGQLYMYISWLKDYDDSGFARYNAETNKWDMLATMSVERIPCCLVELNGYIYAMSGDRQIKPPEDMYIENSYVERYNILTNKWESVSPLEMQGYFVDSTAVAFQNKILIASHKYFDEPDCIIIQSYDPSSNSWIVVLKEAYEGIPLLTVQNSICYLVLNAQSKFTGSKVYRLTCDLDSDSPTVHLGEEILQGAAITKYVGAFSIDDDIFINVNGCVYKVSTDYEVDLTVLANKVTSFYPYPVTYFSFDRRIVNVEHDDFEEY